MPPPSRVSLFVTCLVDQFFPRVGIAAVHVLERCGLQVDFPEQQTCCGQPAFNSGFHDEARRVARTWLQAFRDSEAIVAPSGSCVAMVRHGFAELFEAGTPERDEARRLGARTYELSEFLVSVLGREQLGAAFAGRVAYHESCHLLRELRVSRQPRALLANVAGLDLCELDMAQECCGFGGTFSVKFAQVSTALADDKLASAARAGAEVLVACDMSCLMHLDGRARRLGQPLRCLHLAEVLAGKETPAGVSTSKETPAGVSTGNEGQGA